VDRIKDHGTVERAPLMEGRSMHITVASNHKTKSTEHRAETERKAGAGREAPTDGRPDDDGAPAETPAAARTERQTTTEPAAPVRAARTDGARAPEAPAVVSE
jgi:hypothetical protein